MFEYRKPTGLEEARRLLEEGEGRILLYSGGTEIVSQYRNRPFPETFLMDIKGIPETRVLEKVGDEILIGSNLTLNEMEGVSSDLHRLARGIADHTIRNRITIGGNLCGKLPYREIVLGLLAKEAVVTFLSKDGMRETPLSDRFDKFLQRQREEILLQIRFQNHGKLFIRRWTRNSPIDYPILTLVGRKDGDRLFAGLSGYGAVPLYGCFKDWGAIRAHFLPLAIDNERASAHYRRILFLRTLEEWEAEA